LSNVSIEVKQDLESDAEDEAKTREQILTDFESDMTARRKALE
jgi:hypothetical protein